MPMMPSNLRLVCSSISRTARAMVLLSFSRSMPTSGAPIPATVAIQASSARSDAGISLTR